MKKADNKIPDVDDLWYKTVSPQVMLRKSQLNTISDRVTSNKVKPITIINTNVSRQN